MYAHLFEHETLPGGISARARLNKIWDQIPWAGTCAKTEAAFIAAAKNAGFPEETAEQFLMGDPSV